MSSDISDSGPAPLDLSRCADEPIHIPGAVEPHGVLLVLRGPALRVEQVSANANELLRISPRDLLGAPAERVFGAEFLDRVNRELSADIEAKPRYLFGVRPAGVSVDMDARLHRYQGRLLVELEPRLEIEGLSGLPLFESMAGLMAELREAESLKVLSQRAAEYVRRLIGFDRVMIYRFLEDDSGTVLAEAKRDDLSPYLGLRYPASDIPSQARRLYMLSPVRLKPDVDAVPSPMLEWADASDHSPVDMSYCVLRSMSPIHVQYLKNMEVAASMSISIVNEGRLWGLVACHHLTPRLLSQEARIAGEFLAGFFSSLISAKESLETGGYSTQLEDLHKELNDRMRASSSPFRVFYDNSEKILQTFDADGLVIRFAGDFLRSGTAPARAQLRDLTSWLSQRQRTHVFSTDSLAEHYPQAAALGSDVSGLLSLRISLEAEDFLLFFRRELIQEINWSGNPDKPAQLSPDGRNISPRVSFEIWKQTVRGRSRPWLASERSFAYGLRQSMAEALLVRRNEEITRLNNELARSNSELDQFAYAVSHDLQEPLRLIRGYADIVQRRAGSSLDPDLQELIQEIKASGKQMATLITDLLDYSQVGGAARVNRTAINLDDVLQSVLSSLASAIESSGATISHDPLPSVHAQWTQMAQILQNLLSNAIKFRSEQPPLIHVSAHKDGADWIISVSDNGIGFPPEREADIFRPFGRLHGRTIPGTGLGLSIVKKIVETYDGRVWAESQPGAGSRFSFSMPSP